MEILETTNELASSHTLLLVVQNDYEGAINTNSAHKHCSQTSNKTDLLIGSDISTFIFGSISFSMTAAHRSINNFVIFPFPICK